MVERAIHHSNNNETPINLPIVEAVIVDEEKLPEIATSTDAYLPQPNQTFSNLPTTLEPQVIDAIGSFVKPLLLDGSRKIPTIIEELENSELPYDQQTAHEVLDLFAEAGLLKKGKHEKIKLPKHAQAASLSASTVSDIFSAANILSGEIVTPSVSTLDDIRDLHHAHEEKISVDTVSVDSGPKAEVLYLSEVLFGNQDLDIDFVMELLSHLHSLPEEELPEAIVTSGLLQGNFKYREKDRRTTLVKDLAGIDQQFHAAKLFLDELTALGKPDVIYNMSNDDREICRTYTIEAVRMLKEIGKPAQDTEKPFIPYYEIDQLKQTEAWDRLLAFQTDVVFPYCLRSGRRLRSADEIEQLTDGALRKEEFIILYELAQQGKLTQDGVPDELQGVINTTALPSETDTPTFLITNDVDLSLGHGRNKQDTWVRHNIQLGNASLYQNPTGTAEALIAHNASTGETNPDILVTQHQQLGIGLEKGGTFILSTPGMLKPTLGTNGSSAESPSPSRRQIVTRKIISEPAALSIEQTEDRSKIIRVFNKNLLEKSDASPRTKVAFFMDWQNGSVTARPDLQVKWLDKVFHGDDMLADGPMYVFFNGDIIQGQNYPGMGFENRNMQLVSIDSQERFVSSFISLALADVPQSNLQNLHLVGITPGNHEWNSGYHKYGSTYSKYLELYFRSLLQGKDLDTPVKFYDTLATDKGDFLRSWSGFEPDVAGYGLLVKHLMLEKGAKGSGDKAPIYQAQKLFAGLGDLSSSIDAGVFGHWHHPQFALFGDKIAAVSPSLAGLSGYELDRAHVPQLGALVLHLGGNRAPPLNS